MRAPETTLARVFIRRLTSAGAGGESRCRQHKRPWKILWLVIMVSLSATGFPNPAKNAQKFDARLRRRKVTASEHDAKAILPEPRSIKNQILIGTLKVTPKQT